MPFLTLSSSNVFGHWLYFAWSTKGRLRKFPVEDISTFPYEYLLLGKGGSPDGRGKY